LSNLDKAGREGDKDTQKALQEQLAKEMSGRDKTLDEWEKANRQLEVQSNLLAVIARPALLTLRDQARKGREFMIPAIEGGGQIARSGMAALMESLDIKKTDFAAQILNEDSGPATLPATTSTVMSTGGGATAGGSTVAESIKQVDQMNQIAKRNAEKYAASGGKDVAQYELEQRRMLSEAAAGGNNITVTVKFADDGAADILEQVGAARSLANGRI
jgi:hypothetical protein